MRLRSPKFLWMNEFRTWLTSKNFVGERQRQRQKKGDFQKLRRKERYRQRQREEDFQKLHRKERQRQRQRVGDFQKLRRRWTETKTE